MHGGAIPRTHLVINVGANEAVGRTVHILIIVAMNRPEVCELIASRDYYGGYRKLFGEPCIRVYRTRKLVGGVNPVAAGAEMVPSDMDPDAPLPESLNTSTSSK